MRQGTLVIAHPSVPHAGRAFFIPHNTLTLETPNVGMACLFRFRSRTGQPESEAGRLSWPSTLSRSTKLKPFLAIMHIRSKYRTINRVLDELRQRCTLFATK